MDLSLTSSAAMQIFTAVFHSFLLTNRQTKLGPVELLGGSVAVVNKQTKTQNKSLQSTVILLSVRRVIWILLLLL